MFAQRQMAETKASLSTRDLIIWKRSMAVGHADVDKVHFYKGNTMKVLGRAKMRRRRYARISNKCVTGLKYLHCKFLGP